MKINYLLLPKDLLKGQSSFLYIKQNLGNFSNKSVAETFNEKYCLSVLLVIPNNRKTQNKCGMVSIFSSKYFFSMLAVKQIIKYSDEEEK